MLVVPKNDEISYDQLMECITKRKGDESKQPRLTPKTSYAFKDIEGNDLLSYAILLYKTQPAKFETVLKLINQDIVDKQITGAQITTMLQDALRNALKVDNPVLVKEILNLQFPFLEEKKDEPSVKVSLDKVPLVSCGENCRAFIKTIFKEKINANQSCSDLEEILIRAAELGDLTFIKNKLTSQNKKITGELLKRATQNNHLGMVRYFIEDAQVADLNELNLLTEAINNQSNDVFQYLLEKKSLINEVDHQGYSPLMRAIKIEDVAAVKRLLEKEASMTLQSLISNTIFHIAADVNNIEIWNLLLKQNTEEVKKLIDQQNVYGQTARSILVSRNSDNSCSDIINLLDRTYPHLDKSVLAPLPEVDQGHVLDKMEYYLRLRYRSLDGLKDKQGLCCGFLFLYLWYASQEKRDHFYNVMAQLAHWDGAVDSLERNFDTPYMNDKGMPIYINMDQLFEQWINDVIWFQQEFINCNKDGLSQDDRNAQLNMINQQDNFNTKHEVSSIFKSSQVFLSDFQIAELLNYIGKMSPNTVMEVAGSAKNDKDAHVVGILVKENGLSFYDSSRKYKVTELLPVEQIGRLINSVHSYHPDSMEYYIYSLNDSKKTTKPSLEDFSALLGEEKIPPLDAVLAFQETSANKFTPMHLAIMTNNLAALRHLLSHDHDYSLKEAHGMSSWDIARNAHNLDALLLIAEHVFNVSPDKGVDLLTQLDLEKGSTLLHDLAIKGDISSIKTILNYCPCEKQCLLLTTKNKNQKSVLDIITKKVTDEPADYYPLLQVCPNAFKVNLLGYCVYNKNALWNWAVKEPKHIRMLLENLSFEDYHAAMNIEQGYLSQYRENIQNSFFKCYTLNFDDSMEEFKKIIDCYPEEYRSDLLQKEPSLLFTLAKKNKFDILQFALTCIPKEQQIDWLLRKDSTEKAFIDYFTSSPESIHCLQTIISHCQDNKKKTEVFLHLTHSTMEDTRLVDLIRNPEMINGLPRPESLKECKDDIQKQFWLFLAKRMPITEDAYNKLMVHVIPRMLPAVNDHDKPLLTTLFALPPFVSLKYINNQLGSSIEEKTLQDLQEVGKIFNRFLLTYKLIKDQHPVDSIQTYDWLRRFENFSLKRNVLFFSSALDEPLLATDTLQNLQVAYPKNIDDDDLPRFFECAHAIQALPEGNRQFLQTKLNNLLSKDPPSYLGFVEQAKRLTFFSRAIINNACALAKQSDLFTQWEAAKYDQGSLDELVHSLRKEEKHRDSQMTEDKTTMMPSDEQSKLLAKEKEDLSEVLVAPLTTMADKLGDSCKKEFPSVNDGLISELKSSAAACANSPTEKNFEQYQQVVGEVKTAVTEPHWYKSQTCKLAIGFGLIVVGAACLIGALAVLPYTGPVSLFGAKIGTEWIAAGLGVLGLTFCGIGFPVITFFREKADNDASQVRAPMPSPGSRQG